MHDPKNPEPCEVVSMLDDIARLMKQTDAAIAKAWPHLGAYEAATEAALTDYDFLMRSREVEAIATRWQDALDAAL